jgi:dolichol-phosphate mannosyltransferase
MKKISIIAPLYNEVENLNNFYLRVTKVLDNLNCDYEIIYIDNNSIDGSSEIIKYQINQNSKVKYIKMSRNFGPSVESSICAGLENCSGDAAIVIYTDLQDPPELITEFVNVWQQGYEIVYGKQKKRQGDFFIRNLFVKLYYKIFSYLSDVSLPVNAGDFRLISRNVINHLNSMPEKSRYFRGLSSWIGFKSYSVEYNREPRVKGKSTATFFAIIITAITAITSFSIKPLRIITFFGFSTLIFSLLMTSILIINWSLSNSIPGVTTITVLILATSSINLLSLGIIGEYISRIQTEVKDRPNYIIEAKINF